MEMLTDPQLEQRKLRKVNLVIDPDFYIEPHVRGFVHWAAVVNIAAFTWNKWGLIRLICKSVLTSCMINEHFAFLKDQMNGLFEGI